MNRAVRAVIVGPAVAGAVAGAALPAHAGDRLSIAELAARSEGAVVLEVKRARGKAPDEVAVKEVLGGIPADTRAAPHWLNHCVPRRQELTRWIASNPKWPERKLWQKALASPRWQAVVFLRTIEGERRPSCETEVMLMKHTSLHAGFADYVRAARAALAGPRPPR